MRRKLRIVALRMALLAVIAVLIVQAAQWELARLAMRLAEPPQRFLGNLCGSLSDRIAAAVGPQGTADEPPPPPPDRTDFENHGCGL